MTQPAIVLQDVCKSYEFKTHKGLRGLLHPEVKAVEAVKKVSFTVESGEAVAFIGPNGAGKSTTIKMLSGILTPTSGTLRVLGLEPIKQRRELAMQIGTVFGQRSQLVFNLPLTDSFELTAKMYAVPGPEAKQRIDRLIDQFDLFAFIDQPVRKLSLGQRMRAEVANALIHNPQIIFLDEPTIGLDIVAKRALRDVIKTVNREQGATVFLTSHDVGDIEEVCKRTMIVNHGQIVLDEPTAHLKRDYLRAKQVSVVPADGLPNQCTVSGIAGVAHEGRLTFSVDTDKVALKQFLRQLLSQLDVADLTIEDTPLEDIIHELYTKEKV